MEMSEIFMGNRLAGVSGYYGDPVREIQSLGPPVVDWGLPLKAVTMAQKLSSRQQAQLAFLQMLPPRFQRLHTVIEEMAALRADDVVVRGFARQLDEMRAQAQALNLSRVADTAGLMGTMARRTGGVQVRVRGLREQLGSLKLNYEAALRNATTPEAEGEAEAAPGPD